MILKYSIKFHLLLSCVQLYLGDRSLELVKQYGTFLRFDLSSLVPCSHISCSQSGHRHMQCCCYYCHFQAYLAIYRFKSNPEARETEWERERTARDKRKFGEMFWSPSSIQVFECRPCLLVEDRIGTDVQVPCAGAICRCHVLYYGLEYMCSQPLLTDPQ